MPAAVEAAYLRHTPIVNEWELRMMLGLAVYKLHPFDNAVELGVHEGGVTVLLSHICSHMAVGVDRALQNLSSSRAAASNRIAFVGGDTCKIGTIEAVKSIVGEQIDFLLIDAGHLYVDVKRDFEVWSPLVRPGGLIAIHDIDPAHYQLDGKCEAHLFWPEVHGVQKWEFIYTNQPGSWRGPRATFGGVGVVEAPVVRV